MQEVTDLIQDYIATTNTVIVSTEIKNYKLDKEQEPYDVDLDLYSDYPELYVNDTIG
jgi:hypothetical protein